MKVEDSEEFKQFLGGYVESLSYFSDCFTHPSTGLEVELSECEASEEFSEKCRESCLNFFTSNHADIKEASEVYSCRGYANGWMYAGHDFALTRNGHGAGFWDGDLPEELGKRLTEAAHAAGEVYPYLGDDGLIHIA